MAARPAAPEELDDIVSLIARQQVEARRQITYLGTTPPGIRAELDGLEPAWAVTARVLDRPGPDEDGLLGAVVVEWDADLGRAWILGPWIDEDGGDDDDEAWLRAAGTLLDAALAQLPPAIVQHELSGDVANTRLGALAAARGWLPTEANHALVADTGTVAGWVPAGDDDGLRRPGPDDVESIALLHDAEFPATYASAAQLVDGQAAGERVVLVAPGADADGGIAGYAAGQVHDDGEGFIDFVAVAPAARGTGLGRRLVQALTRELLDRSPAGRVSLTVQHHRQAARALYEQLGFRPDGTFLAYRDWAA